MATDKYALHTIDYSVQGWDAIMTTDMEKLDDVIHTRIKITAGETVAQYDAVYLESDGKYDLALADGSQQPVMGLALESAVLDDEILIQRIGPITNAGWAWATVGAKVYLSDADLGELTDVKPAANDQIVGIVLSATSIFIAVGLEGAAGYTNLTSFVDQTAWRIFYSNADGEITELALGANGTYLKSNGVAVAPTFAVPAGAGNVVGPAANNDEYIPQWNGADSKTLKNGFAKSTLVTNPLTAQLNIAEHDIKLDSLLSADGKYSGRTCDGVLGAILVFGDLVYLNTTDQRWELADADAEATSGDVMLAIVLAAGNDGDTRLLLLQGFIRKDAWNFTSYGQALYVSLTAGDMTQNISGHTTGDIGRVVGYASTFAGQIYFKPSRTWLELA